MAHLLHERDAVRAHREIIEQEILAIQKKMAATRERLRVAESELLARTALDQRSGVKRALHAILDGFQAMTPEPVRAAVRKHYLKHFYFRVSPTPVVDRPQAPRGGARRDHRPFGISALLRI